MIDLNALIISDIKFKKIWESPCKNHRVLYFQINKTDNGINAHFHPYGEDHALILEGELTYDISFEEQIVAKKNTLVFGWTNYVHGYRNYSETPLHILVFATPENNLTEYNQSELPTQNYNNIRFIDNLSNIEQIFSDRMIFSSVPPKDVSNTLIIDLENRKIGSAQYKVDSNEKLYITFKSPVK